MDSYIPKMLTIRQIADLGIMPEHALRQLVKENQILHVKIGNKVLINYTALCEQLNRPPIIENIEKG